MAGSERGAHDGSHGHGESAGHSHAPGAGSDHRYLLIALALLTAFMAADA